MAIEKNADKTAKATAKAEEDEVSAANQRADAAEAEVARLKKEMTAAGTTEAHYVVDEDVEEDRSADAELAGGEDELRKDSMMAHLLDSLEAKKDIGHYGRLVFAMVARHFMPHEEVLGWLTRDPDFESGEAEVLLRQVEGKDYNPPKRERILEWHAQQEFPILPKPEDPDCGNLYRNLKFPDAIYEHIEHYQEQKIAAE